MAMSETKRILILVVASSFLFLAQADMRFDFPSFNESNMEDIVTEGDAIRDSANTIQLTKGMYIENFNWSLGWAVYKDPIRLWRKSSPQLGSFQTYFQFEILKGLPTPNATYADGLAFFMAPVGSAPPVNGSGMWLGLFNETTNGKNSTQTVAVEFDTFKNAQTDQYHTTNPHDPDDNHVGIDVNNITSVKNYSLPWDQRLNGNITWHAWVDYNGTEKTLRVFLAANDSSKPSYPNLSYGINLSEFLPEEVLVGFSASTGLSHQLHIIMSWTFSIQIGDSDNSTKLIIIAVVCCLVVISAMAFLFFLVVRSIMKTRSTRVQERKTLSRVIQFRVQGGRPREYKYNELRAATNNFSEDQKLGEGGFGSVYKGVLQDSRETVAVKRISAGSRQGSKEYLSEVTIIDQLRHRNLVPLLGWCHEKPGELLLVYKFMSKGSLDKYLFTSSGADQPTLEWNMRYRIACDLASALVYLHDEFEKRVLHRDIKSSNIMLDSEFHGHLGDFGLARVIEHGHCSHFTAPGGTRGYLPPESIISGIASAETDVFSFGVVALEIASGRRALYAVGQLYGNSYWPLVGWVWDLYGKNCLLDAADNRLNGRFDAREMMRLMAVGLWCCNPDWKQRPKIRQVIQTLKFEALLPRLPSMMPRFIVLQPELHSDRSYSSEFHDSVPNPATEPGVTTDRIVEDIYVPVTL